MTSEPDSKPGRRPPTIELKATEVEAEKPDSAKDSTPTNPAAEPIEGRNDQSPDPGARERSGSRLRSHTVGGVIGAIAMAAIMVGLWMAGDMPPRESAPAPSAPPPAEASAPAPQANNADISARFDKIEQTLQAQRPEPALGDRLAAVETATKSLSDKLAALNHRVDDTAATGQNAAKQAAAAAATVKSANQSNVQRSDIDALAARIAALESEMKTLSGNVANQASSTKDQAARLTIAAEALRAAVERGVPYQAAFKAVQALGADQNATAPLETLAATGVQSAAALAHSLAILTPALKRASHTAASESTFMGRLEASARQLVRVTPIDAPAGHDPAAVIARIKIDAAHADIAAALDDVAALPNSVKPLAADWVEQAKAREQAIAAARQIAADALAAFNKPAAQ